MADWDGTPGFDKKAMSPIWPKLLDIETLTSCAILVLVLMVFLYIFSFDQVLMVNILWKGNLKLYL
jgi:hypothetical protein